MPKSCSAIVLSVLFLGGMVRADHLPDSLLAGGRPENVLAGIDLEHTTLAQVVSKWGQPTTVQEEDYYWDKGTFKLHLIIESTKEQGEYIAAIEIEGNKFPDSLGRTGRGLRLGDSLRDLIRIYGKKFQRHRVPLYDVDEVSIQWRREEITLDAQFDSRGKIKILTLLAPE